MGYEGTGPIGKRKEGIVEPIQPTVTHPKDKTWLGYGEDTKEAARKKSHEEIALTILRLHDNSDIDSNEYEWDTIYDEFWRDKKVDFIQKYTPILTQGESSRTQPLDYVLQDDHDSSKDDSIQNETDNQ